MAYSLNAPNVQAHSKCTRKMADAGSAVISTVKPGARKRKAKMKRWRNRVEKRLTSRRSSAAP
ncbi:hypothetical protein MA16_Dca025184 [Dendrobium catenatum]|uniref:Uncharacterized protein n=1 Tax=Dendrobium catenatum TaxID=906689 RepID=A0A2I0WZA7_9ASPA|nr:hypothetical protein MA16_Dca025184 [Dendrobium catenatum]